MPLPTSFVADLKIRAARIYLERNDELARTGSGVWAAELAAPTWAADLALASRRPPEARAVDAKLRALGANSTMLLTDPSYAGPAADPGGTTIGAAIVTIHTISADRSQIRLTGLPAAYDLTAGDRLSVLWNTNHYWLAEVSSDATSDGAGLTPLFNVYPYVPGGITAGATAELVAPVVEMRVRSYTGFEALPGYLAGEASLSLIQRP